MSGQTKSQVYRFEIMAQDIFIRYYQTKFPEGISVSTTSYHDHQFPKHFHDHYTIQLIEEGVNEGFTELNKYKVGKGGLLVINPGELHAGNSLNSEFLKFHTLRFNESFIQAFHEKNEIPLHDDILFVNRPLYCSKRSNQAFSLIFNIKANNHLAFECELNDLLVGLTRNQIHPSSSAKASLELARQFLHDNYKKNLTLAQIAASCHLSPYHFLRQFKKQFGIAPFQYLRNIRIEKAKMLLPSYSISEAAHQVGFYDHSHFLRYYKKIEGTTPSSLLKR